MNAKSFLAKLVCLVLVTSGSTSANEVIVSFSDFGDSGPLSNNSSTISVGESGSAFIWLQVTEDIDTLVVTDFLLSASSIVALTGGEVFNPDIIENGTTDIGNRWDNTGNGSVAVDGVSLSGVFGFATGLAAGVDTSTGILTNQTGTGAALDQLYDPVADAFLFARIDFDALSRGTVDINPTGIFLNNGDLSNFAVTGGTVTVIPEPSMSVLLIAVSAGGMLRRRR